MNIFAAYILYIYTHEYILMYIFKEICMQWLIWLQASALVTDTLLLLLLTVGFIQSGKMDGERESMKMGSGFYFGQFFCSISFQIDHMHASLKHSKPKANFLIQRETDLMEIVIYVFCADGRG